MFCPSSSAWQSEGFVTFEGFHRYLISTKQKTTVSQYFSYAKRYGHILRTRDASELLSLSPRNKHHAMLALASLSKYLGCYNVWKDIRERYQLKWTIGDSLTIFNDIFNSEKTLTSMMNWLTDTCSKIPKSYSNILIYDTLTGLRPDEACKSLSLIHNELDNYLNTDKMILEHYKYPSLFLRKTKKAYISILNDSILSLGKKSGDYGYNAIRLAVKHRGLEMHMAYCRKIFATYLRKDGIESEIIDLLQGRIPKSVFARHYFRPSTEVEFDRIRKSLESLQKELTI